MTGSAGGLDAHLVVDRAGFRLDVRLRIAPGQVVALLGPNGAGKTTALRALAGLRPLTAGHVTLDGRDLDRPADRVWVPPQRRRVGVVFQDHVLFPHRTVLWNVAFGPRRQGLDRRAARQVAEQWLGRLGLADLAGCRPRQLSGGQAQRVALARALAVRPALLLLDEPLAALDARTRLDVRAELRRHVAGFPGATLLITHDPLDALVLADRLVVVEAGRVVQQGDPVGVTAGPRTDYVARLVGLNLLRGRVADGRVWVGGLPLSGTDLPAGEVFVAFPPSAVVLDPGPPPGGDGSWSATVTDVQRHGEVLRVRLDGVVPVDADVAGVDVARWSLTVGRTMGVAVRPDRLRVYPVRDTNQPSTRG